MESLRSCIHLGSSETESDGKNMKDTLFCRWREFGRNMFWLAVIGGSLLLLRFIIIIILKWKRNSEEQKFYGALILPRFEIFLTILALPCICQASTSLIKGIPTALLT